VSSSYEDAVALHQELPVLDSEVTFELALLLLDDFDLGREQAARLRDIVLEAEDD
jgi:hypothetical protein